MYIDKSVDGALIGDLARCSGAQDVIEFPFRKAEGVIAEQRYAEAKT
ncbi:hypothetical protein SAMN05216516_10637 [Izhakiella capsodis]|uniref:Uncharacterized protein n=2 Tax=Izhakiella capsodis TaxID=1367852 RepID=A0A1I4YCL1_9GAMM|nr:hypothetical protein SAMN05216516_10637 [Izhakiella capsodis]